MRKRILEGFPLSHAAYTSGPFIGRQAGVSAVGFRPGVSESLGAMCEALLTYGDVCLGIPGTAPGSAERANYEAYLRASAGAAEAPSLRITRRNNVVVEVGGRVVAMAFSTHGIKGRRARREAAEQYLERRSHPLTADEILGLPRHPRADPMAN